MNLKLVIFVGAIYSTFSQNIKLQNNGYTGILVSIHEDVKEDENIINELKNQLKEASKELYAATNRRAYFKDITILIPNTWKNNNYQNAQTENHENANIKIQRTKNVFQHAPYTKTYKGCGEQAEYIRLSDEYLLNRTMFEKAYGALRKIWVHEWAHFRWGVFDEYSDDSRNQFYFDFNKEIVTATKCHTDIQGKIFKQYENLLLECERVSPDTGTFEDGCVFYPHLKQPPGISTSYMYRQYISEITSFCDASNHNKLAPNNQNNLCNMKSVWEIMDEHEDFKNNANPSGNLADNQLLPSFTLIRYRKKPIVLVLDNSGSMGSENMFNYNRLVHAGDIFLRDGIGDNYEVGIVKFDNSGRTVFDITAMNSESIRKTASERIRPTGNLGGTVIATGLDKAIDMLENYQGGASGSSILIISDGQDGGPQLIPAAKQRAKSLGIRISTLALSNSADPSLITLATETGGTFFYDDNKPDQASMIQSLLSIIDDYRDDNDDVIPLAVNAKEIQTTETWKETVTMDKANGKNTVFIIVYVWYPVAVKLTSPTNKEIPCNHESLYKLFRCKVSGIAEAGEWKLTVTTNNIASKQQVIITALTQAIGSAVDPIEIRSTLSNQIAKIPPRLVIYAEVTKGDLPVLGMVVTATIERPDGKKIEIDLRDSGAEPDIFKNDGVYSRYFTQITGTGRYSVSVRVKGPNGGEAVVSTGTVGSFAAMLVNPLNPVVPIMGGNTLTVINAETDRITTPGAFEIVGSTGSTTDQTSMTATEINALFPPNKITDLQVIATSYKNGWVTLKWTAPGGNADAGTAHSYHIRTANDLNGIMNNPETVTNQDIVAGTFKSLSNPSNSGTRENVTLRVTRTPGQNSSHIFRVQAYDGFNYGAWSNIASAGLGFTPDLNIEELSILDQAKANKTLPPKTTALPKTTDVEKTTVLLTTTLLPQTTALPSTNIAQQTTATPTIKAIVSPTTKGSKNANQGASTSNDDKTVPIAVGATCGAVLLIVSLGLVLKFVVCKKSALAAVGPV